MWRARISRGLTGLAAGALLGAGLLGVFALGALLGLSNAAFTLFEWLTRVLPGRLVIFGLETTLSVLEAFGLSIKDASKATEEALALTELFAASAVAGLVLFAVWKPGAAGRRGIVAGAAAGGLMLIPVIAQSTAAGAAVALDAAWVLVVFVTWGWALGRVFSAAYPEPQGTTEVGGAVPARQAPPATPGGDDTSLGAERIDRRHFIIRAGGLVATFVVLGAEVADVLRVAGGPSAPAAAKPPIPFPNADAAVKPVPGTRPEYTPVAEHYRVDIDLSPPEIDGASWRLSISGLVMLPQQLTLGQLRSDYRARDQFITLECISNPVGGPLIGTTLWSGPSLRDVLAAARPQADARYAHILSEDGYDEVVALDLVRDDPRVILAYDWNGEPLPSAHGYPLRIYIPDLYGMKQPKWIKDIVLVRDFIPGYWVHRGWDAQAIRRTTSVIDTVATGDLQRRGGQTFVPVGGIADAGARGISRVEVQVDGGAWEAAELREPLSSLTWVLWRYEWPYRAGEHTFAVRAYDGDGKLQTTESNPSFPRGATGVSTEGATLLSL